MATRPDEMTMVEEVGRHRIYRDNKDGKHYLWTEGAGWWGFHLDLEEARSTCRAVS